MALAAGGNARAFELIFDRHSAVAYSLAYRICASRAMADDVLQEAFLALWRSSDRYDAGRGCVRAWLLSVVHNRAIDAIRRARVRVARDIHDAEVAERLASPERTDLEVLRRDEAGRVRRALVGLPPEQRQVLELAYFHGLTHREIALLLELPAGTVKGRTRLGLQKLREELAPGEELDLNPPQAMRASSPR
jgi:RNA polymerase sigma-70 factor (ECF subfamily)